MSRTPLTRQQPPGATSPWPLGTRIRAMCWEICWRLLCSWTPKPANRWRLLILRLFGARIFGCPFVHQRGRIQLPWNIELHDRACVGDRANLYSLDTITIKQNAVVAQEAYLCAGTHGFDDPELPLLTAPITVEARAFIGARAFVLPGVTLGEESVVGAMSVVSRNVAPRTTVVGNPASPVRKTRS